LSDETGGYEVQSECNLLNNVNYKDTHRNKPVNYFLGLLDIKGVLLIPSSIRNRIRNRIQALIKGEQPKNLVRFVGNHRQDMPKGIAYSLIDYCKLVDCTSRCIREDKAGYIEQHHSPF
jgi:hypothetical protein